MNDRYLHIMMAKGEELWKKNHLAEARSTYEELVQLFPEEPELFHRLGSVSLEQGDNIAAEGYFRKLVQLRPDSTEAKMLLGMTCAERGLHQPAVEYLQQVVAECPGVVEVHHRLGLSLAELHRYPEALKSYQEALAASPGHSGILCSIGLLLSSMGRLAESQQYLMKALESDPNNLGAMNNLGRVVKMRGKAADGLTWFWEVLERDRENGPATSNFLYTLNYVPGIPPDRIAVAYRELAPRTFSAPAKISIPEREDRFPSQPLRIGYVSADFYGHSVAFFLEPVLLNHDPARFEIFCYSNRAAGDETTARLRALAAGWRQINGATDQQVAAMIAEDRIDILVDLSGHTAGHRLGVFTYRPAPVQASWIGHPNTTGLPQMDYYITDSSCDPPGMTDRLFCERLWRLPRIFSCYRPPAESPEVAPPPALTTGAITFGCFNNFAKVNDVVIDWWAAILNRLPGSRLYLKNQSMNDVDTRSYVIDTFARHGIGFERLVMQGITKSREEHFALYANIDIALDTFPYHGTTTTCEALWMGVPVISLAGTTHVSRVGVSLLHAVGLDKLVAATPEEYVHHAIELANNSQQRRWLRENLRSIMLHSPLMDAAGVTRDVEQAYFGMLNQRLQHVAEVSFNSGKSDVAEACYRQLVATTPSDPGLHNCLATVLDHQGHYAEAIAHYQKALELQPDLIEVRCNMANTLGHAGAPAEAIQQLQEILAETPDYLRGWQTLAHYCLREGRKDDALHCLSHLVRLDPENAEAWRDLADLYEERREFRNALHCLEKALARLPDDVDLLNSTGLLRHELGDLDGAESAYLRALSLDPGNAVLHNNMGNIYKSRLMMNEAIAWYDRALANDGDNASIIFNRSLAILALGNCDEGWRGFERRFDMTPPVVLPHRDLPEWNGEPLNGRRLLVQSEQVFGDTFMFARFVPTAASCGGPVVFQCQDHGIRKALASLAGDVEALVVRGESMPRPDVQVPLLSLPGIFGVNLGNIPAPAGYLTADPARVEQWRTVIPRSRSLNVGLVWGGRKAPLNSDRSMPLQTLEPLLLLRDVHYFSLQTGDDACQITDYTGKIDDLNPLLTDFGETAAAITNLDLVITIDTAVAHLAGALGKPVWVMLKYSPDWRWLLVRDDSPWYASARLFRQASPGNWAPTVSAIKTALENLLTPGKKI
ncbi:MAG: hypothetical protein A2X58_12680 [Nitrospirae bacterium GWC2_56_14]|nr:MAG: hypothetical protein A2X58_12680 [Nitrospirae bacterium GWC2_56_14]